jgi:hypothetical protein
MGDTLKSETVVGSKISKGLAISKADIEVNGTSMQRVVVVRVNPA